MECIGKGALAASFRLPSERAVVRAWKQIKRNKRLFLIESSFRIFVSHSHKDNDFGFKLVQDLRRVLGDETAVWYDARGGLHGGDFVLAERLADDVEPAGERGITERPIGLSREPGPDGGGERFLRIGQFALRLGERRRDRADRVTGALHGWPPPQADQS